MREIPEPNPRTRQLANTCSLIFMVAGIVVYQAIASSVFSNPAEHGFSAPRAVIAGVVGGGCALIGFAIGKLIEKIRG